LAQCPHRDKCPFPEMRPPSTDGLFRFDMRAKRRQFNQTSAAPTWGPQVNAPSPAGPLSPGETAYRTLDAHHDIRPQLEMGIVCGGLVAVVGLCGYIGVTVPASVPVVAAWHRFCKSVQFRNKRFSGAQSKRDKVPIGDWDTITRIWVGRGWLLPFKAGETPTLTARGRAWVRAYAETPPEEAK